MTIRYLTPRSDQSGMARHGLTLVIFAIFVFTAIGTFHSIVSNASAKTDEIHSGISGDCLDDHEDGSVNGSVADDYTCNGSQAQAWEVAGINIKHGNLCLSTAGSAKIGSPVLLNTCASLASQIWLKDGSGLYNPASQLCLSGPVDLEGNSLSLQACNSLTKSYEVWTSPDLTIDCSGVRQQGDRVACFAEKEWETWQSGSISHESLLNSYTDGAPYEEWCADFVSYVYKEAGYPFVNGEADGWDESNANYVQNQGFTIHNQSNYTPQPGDVGFFDYSGGHVEIVISGGKQPTFIYGNSATIDPTTGNGEMEANTKLQDGDLGNLVYYLSPN